MTSLKCHSLVFIILSEANVLNITLCGYAFFLRLGIAFFLRPGKKAEHMREQSQRTKVVEDLI